MIIVLITVLLTGCGEKTFTIDEINNPKQVELPIDSASEATSYSLSFSEVREHLSTREKWHPDTSQISETKYDEEGNRYREKVDKWSVRWFPGEKCSSSHGCTMTFTSAGDVAEEFTCSEGWNCK